MGHLEDRNRIEENLEVCLSSLEKIREIGFSNQRDSSQIHFDLKLIRRVLQAELLLRETLAELR